MKTRIGAISWALWPVWRNGRRDGLKIRFPLKECRFESDHRYQQVGPAGALSVGWADSESWLAAR